MEVDKGSQHPLVEVVPLAKVIANGSLVQPFALVQEGGNVLRRVDEQAVLDEELDALLGVHVEFLPADRHLLGARVVLTANTRRGTLEYLWPPL